jgi:hypothetical protein
VRSLKERRKAGATHSFRLTQEACNLLEDVDYPRRLGGMSKLVSDAIVWYWSKPEDRIYDPHGHGERKVRELLQSSPSEIYNRNETQYATIKQLREQIEALEQLKKPQSDAPSRGWRHILFGRASRLWK